MGMKEECKLQVQNLSLFWEGTHQTAVGSRRANEEASCLPLSSLILKEKMASSGDVARRQCLMVIVILPELSVSGEM